MTVAAVDPTENRSRLVAMAFVLVVAVCAVILSPNFRERSTVDARPFAGDFVQEYLGGYIVLHGDHSRFYDPTYAIELQHNPAVVQIMFDRERFLPIIYPPFYYLLASPMALLPFHAAAFVWAALMIACLIATFVVLARAYPQFADKFAWVAPLAVLFPPLLENLGSSQKATVALLILTSTFVLLDRRRPFWAGLVFGLLAFKPQLTLVIAIAMVCKRQWWFVLGGFATGCVLFGLSLIVGADVCLQYWDISQRMGEYINTGGFPHEKMHCWYGFFRLLLPEQSLGTIQSATAIVFALTVAILFMMLRGPLQIGRPSFAIQFSGLVVATVLLSPHLLTYDLTILLLPLLLMTGVLQQADSKITGRSAVVTLMIAAFAVSGMSAAVASRTRIQLSVLIFTALLASMTYYLGGASAARTSEAAT